MLSHPLYEKLAQLRLAGMLLGLKEQMNCPEVDRLSFEERLGLLVDRQITERETTSSPRGLKKPGCDKTLVWRMSTSATAEDWIRRRSCSWPSAPGSRSITMCSSSAPPAWEKPIWPVRSPTRPVAKDMPRSTSACLGCCRSWRLPGATARYVSLLKTIARADLLVLDDWGLKGFSAEQQHDLLEILEDRHGLRSTLITSQLPVDHWHELITNSTVADAICDRLVHNGYRITLKGESMRKMKNKLT